MLILDRYAHEKILIGPDIQIILLDAYFKFARIGIKAPKDIPVDREEIYNSKMGAKPTIQKALYFHNHRNNWEK